MSTTIPFNVVGICTPDGEVVGSGVLVDTEQLGLCVLTCAHVLNEARGYKKDLAERHQGKVVQFKTPDHEGLLSAEVIECHPPKALEELTKDDPSDVALLQVQSKYIPKANAYTWQSFRRTDGTDRTVRSFGFSTSVGQHAIARLDGSNAAGRLQISSENDFGVFIAPGFSGAPVFDETFTNIIGMFVSVSTKEGERVAYAISVRSIWAACPQLARPYKGLAEFDEKDAEFFCGRAAFVDKLKDTLEVHAILGVTADSGMGKSSVVKAGLIPELKNEHGWCIIQMRPNKDPWSNLASAVDYALYPEVKRHERSDRRDKLAAKLRANPDQLTDELEEYAKASQSTVSKVLILLNQFEELFTLAGHNKGFGEGKSGTDGAVSNELDFRDLMVATARLKGKPSIQWIYTLRADFSGPAFRHPEFNDAVGKGNISLPDMYPDELRDAIRKPGSLLGVSFAPAEESRNDKGDEELSKKERQEIAERSQPLDERIADAVESKSQSLPLMSHLLAKLWDRIDNRQLTHDAYFKLGGIGGALNQHAQEVYDNLNEEQKTYTRQLFYRLVKIGEENGEITRQIRTRAELGDDLWSVAHILAEEKHRLLTIRGSAGVDKDDSDNHLTAEEEKELQTVEVAHEALLIHWKLLAKTWVRDNRSFILWRQTLEQRMRGHTGHQCR